MALTSVHQGRAAPRLRRRRQRPGRASRLCAQVAEATRTGLFLMAFLVVPVGRPGALDSSFDQVLNNSWMMDKHAPSCTKGNQHPPPQGEAPTGATEGGPWEIFCQLFINEG